MAEGKHDHTADPDLRQHIEEWAEELELLWQNKLLDENRFLTFTRNRGIRVSGVVTGDPGKFHQLGWLTSDGVGYDDRPLFHPFRLYPLHQILKACSLNLAASSSIHRDQILELTKYALSLLPTLEGIGKATLKWNQIADLAIFLDPVYWSMITGRQTYPSFVDENELRDLLNSYRIKVLELVRTLDPKYWRQVHEELRIDAAWMDDNGGLYLLLRLAPWSKRERLEGAISGALWLRHIAETIRRAFEEVHAVRWPEEDEAFGHWVSGGRARAYGSERPLDHVLESKPYLAWEFGLFTGSVVRWYVEGETEYYAICHILPEASKVGIELVNLKGNIEAERDNAVLKLGEWLKQDRVLRRFSIISFDTDVYLNVKAIRRQVEEGRVVGYIDDNTPDFEFANFTSAELIEIAARLDEAHGVSGDNVRNGDWSGIESGRAFEKRYVQLSALRPRSLKGKEWGEALAGYAIEYPDRSDDGTERPLWKAVGAALRSRIANYDAQQKHFKFDPMTFEIMERRNDD